MALATYDDLKAAIADWLNRTDLTAQIPDFIALTEASLNRDLRTREMVTTASLTVTAGNALVAMTDAMAEVRSVVLRTNPKAVLQYLTLQALDARYALSVSGKPSAYTVSGAALKLAPVPDAAYALDVTYYAPVTALSDENPSNWVLASHPDLYLYGALVQASPFLGDDGRISTWAELYGRALGMLEAADTRAQWAGSPLVMDTAQHPALSAGSAFINIHISGGEQ